MESFDLILAVESGGALAVGIITMLIVFRTFSKVEDKEVKEFSKRFMFMVSLMILLTSYTILYATHLHDIAAFSYTLFVLIALVFIGILYTTLSFERVASKHGFNAGEKMERMANEENIS